MKPILQVEDDPNDIFLLQHAMRKAGTENPIEVATDGQQAIEYLQGAGRFADRAKYPFPCLVLLDLKLPGIMGLDVLRWIRQEVGVGLIVLLLSSSGDDDEIAAAYRLGANGYLVKPSQASRLVDMARSIKDFWLVHNSIPRNYGSKRPLRGSASTRSTPLLPKPLLTVHSATIKSQNLSKHTHETNYCINL